jgi:hypothetical protein
VAARTLGAQPLRATRYYEGNAAVQEAMKAATGARQRLIADFAQARMQGESVADAQRAIAEFNARHPQPGVRITASALARSVQERRRVARSRNGTGVQENANTRPFLQSGRFADVN